MKQASLLLVMLLPLAGCGPKPPKTAYARLNDAAKINGSLPWNPRTGQVITSWMNPGGTMTTLYGDDAAVNFARTQGGDKYPAGSKLGAVTWKQEEDPRWFGGRIPSNVVEVELLTVNGSGAAYTRYEGSPLASVSAPDANDRTAFLLQQRAAVMP